MAAVLLIGTLGGVTHATVDFIAMVAMYATAMFGMVILVGLSGQVSLGNGALMAVGGYTFALVSMNWQSVPLLGVPMNGWWAMVFAAIGGIAAVVTALVEDLITPLIAAFGGQPDFSALVSTLNGSEFKYGHFLNAVISFVTNPTVNIPARGYSTRTTWRNERPVPPGRNALMRSFVEL